MEQDKEWLLKEKYHGEETKHFFEDVKRLESGEPLAYVIGFVPFLNTKIYLDSRPLIPRTETEFWVEKAIKEIQNHRGRTPMILDLCAGSGCVGVAVLKAVSNSHVDFVEIDKKHHKTILENLYKNGIEKDRSNVIGGSLFDNVTEKYDFILTNPPYIDPVLDRTETDVKKFEPHKALYGGDAGLLYISTIIKESSTHLVESGIIYIEHEPEQKEQVNQLATLAGLKAESFSDQFGIIRYTRLSQNIVEK